MISAPACHLTVAGRLERNPYPALAKELGIKNRVYFLRMVPDTASLMRSLDTFVFSSRYEPTGLVLLDATASSLPVICAHSVGCAEIVGDYACILADPNDADTRADWMNERASSPGPREVIERKTRAIAQDYSWQRRGTSHLDLYQKFLSSESS
jgi:glycosyltransferase involved in cell wall biosynthesis